MKVCLILVALAAACTAQVPAGWRPSGRVLLLPARIQEEPTTPIPQSNSTQSDEKESDRILDSGEYYVLLEDGKLQMVKYSTSALKEEEKPDTQQSQQTQQSQKTQYPVYQQPQQAQQYQKPQQAQQYQGSQNNQYPVYQQPQQPQKYQQPQQSQQYSSPSAASSGAYPQQANPEPFAQFQVEYVQFPLPGSEFAQTKQQYTAPEADGEPKEKAKDAEEPAGYEAKVQYRDVKPISAPIYAYNSAPLVRILKK